MKIARYRVPGRPWEISLQERNTATESSVAETSLAVVGLARRPAVVSQVVASKSRDVRRVGEIVFGWRNRFSTGINVSFSVRRGDCCAVFARGYTRRKDRSIGFRELGFTLSIADILAGATINNRARPAFANTL